MLVSGSADAAVRHAGKLSAATRASVARGRPFMSFRSRPDLRPPVLTLSNPSAAADTSAEGLLFLAPTSKPGAQAGALIVDASGQPVWFNPVRYGSWVSNFRVQTYRGEPVLTFWQGVVRPPGFGHGEGVILDSSYRQVGLVRAAHGRAADLHEFRLTPWGTALITCFPQTAQADLSAVGGPPDGQVYESIIQEIDVQTGRLRFEWRSLEHIPVRESYLPLGGVYDYLHVNSIDFTPDGHLLVSGRNTCALYKVDRHSGQVLWRLGGQRSDFAIGRGAHFNWQHDAQHVNGTEISVFDNGLGPVQTEPQSRGLVLHVDQVRRTVRLIHAYRHPPPLRTSAMGSVQPLADGNVVVGWGLVPTLSEFSPDGSLITELRLPWGYNIYRGFRMPWEGTPTDQPALAARPGPASGTSVLYASWNGATGVADWQLSVGQSATSMQPVGIFARSGFETAIPVANSQGYAAVSALDSSGTALGRSAPVAL